MLERIPAAVKMYLMFAPLAILGLVVGLITKSSLETNAHKLIVAHEIKELAVTSLALLLTQDDATKAMLFNPDDAALDARKIRAYDQNKAVLDRIITLSKSPEIHDLVNQLKKMDETQLRPMDTSVLELLWGGKREQAKELYFTKYEPGRTRYEVLLRKLAGVAELSADAASQTLETKSKASLTNICVALGIGILIMMWAMRQEAARRSAEDSSRAKGKFLAETKKVNAQLKQENSRMSAELEITQRLQQMMLPRADDLREIANLDISGFMEPAAEVGGDYYDVVLSDGGVNFSIGDVTGHGLESGVIAIVAQTAVRTLLASGISESGKFFEVLNRVIYDNTRRMNCDRNLTLSLLRYKDRHVTISGQHEEVLVVRDNGALERHDTLNLGFPLGLEENISSFIGESSVPLRSGDVLVLYTDGITEAINSAGVTYGIDRLSEVVRSSHAETADGIRRAVLTNLHEYIGGQDLLDDISLLVVKPA